MLAAQGGPAGGRQLVYVYENLKLVYKFGSYINNNHLDMQDT